MAKAPGFSVTTLPTRSGDQALRFWELASPEAAPGHPPAGAGNRLEQVPSLRVDGVAGRNEGHSPFLHSPHTLSPGAVSSRYYERVSKS